MSASGLIERMATVQGAMQACRLFAGVDVPAEDVPILVVDRDKAMGWAGNDNATSCGAVMWLKNRLREKGYLGEGYAVDDGYHPVLQPGKGKSVRFVEQVARSKIFHTNWKIIEPIDLTTGRVAGFGFLFRRAAKAGGEG